jgi:hypothetical protein
MKIKVGPAKQDEEENNNAGAAPQQSAADPPRFSVMCWHIGDALRQKLLATSFFPTRSRNLGVSN